jgi:hypothetical protein
MALIDNETRLRYKFGIKDNELYSIKCFLQGAVYCWVKNKEGAFFAARDLMGGKNFDWKGTPLFCLYQKHIAMGKDNESAIDEAGRDLGWILKTVLHEDKRSFKVQDNGRANGYQWVE